ncbi:hypothetical protein NicSoilC5_30560 [Arthrobacter sp. NicSoilC5]|nr:hypothetical protein NicSoilC5_30560 [Arthrobacter sp. NicSoilC5]
MARFDAQGRLLHIEPGHHCACPPLRLPVTVQRAVRVRGAYSGTSSWNPQWQRRTRVGRDTALSPLPDLLLR